MKCLSSFNENTQRALRTLKSHGSEIPPSVQSHSWWPNIISNKDLWKVTGQEDINVEIR
jgi:hypothetical protein